ncbi:Transcription factor tau subunit sfc3 [Leucoagaricus sp. SymC.cos]|nr:Transcription factor tau subunit sfc3 [Leucoagaricus sp. SymC.cos]
MDDLVHHCLRELSFDGDLGSNVSRLKDFIVDFYRQPEAPHAQNPDDAFCAFIWSLVVQQPTIRVGTILAGQTSEVWIAPQTSKTKKAKERGEEPPEVKPPQLDIIPDARNRSLESLVAEFGDRLRIAVEPNAIYAAITGSHIRFAKLSPMVYSALQVITRGRDNGVSVVSLGKQTDYDQKTCFYLIKQLQELNLVVKVPKPGIGTNFAIHRYFFDKSPHWKAIREEENKAEEEDKIAREVNEETIEDEALSEKPILDFTPIDARHLSSLPLVRSRVVKLLKASKNYIHESNNMLITIGFSTPTKTDRRFFQSRIKELIQQGVIEKVVVPSLRKKASTAMVKCFRLVTADNKSEGVILDTQDDEEAEEQEKSDLAKEVCGVKMNVTLHKQIFNLLEEAGTRGMTLSELSIALCNFDKRTIELLLARADKVAPPPHLSDLGIAGLMETSGRERRHRYYTIVAYCKLIAQEKLDPTTAGYAHIDCTDVGEFTTIDPAQFYEDENALTNYQDAYQAQTATSVGRKKKVPKNPVLPDGSIKLGRPRKHPVKDTDKGSAQTPKGGRKRKADESKATESSEPASKRCHVQEDMNVQPGSQAPRRRGRPPKIKAPAPAEPVAPASEAALQEVRVEETSILQAAPKKRGRPSKKRPIVAEVEGPLRRSKRKRGSEQGGADVSAVEVASPLSSEAVPCLVVEAALPPQESASPLNASDDYASAQIEPFPQQRSEEPSRQAVQAESEVNREDDVPIDPSLIGEEPVNIQQQPSDTADMQPTNVKAIARGRINVSNLRRETEICRVIESLGGIAHTQSKEFSSAHLTLLETMTKVGEPTSAPPGTKTDKRTLMATLDALEARGKIKQLKTSIQTHTGINRAARIAYLPHVTEIKLKDYLTDLARTLQPAPQTASFVKIDEKLEYGADPTTVSRSILPLQLLQLEQPGTDRKERWSKNSARANQLFAYDDETIRDVLLAERTTLGQLYGFIVGKMARIRELHLLLLRSFESNQPSFNLVSREEMIFDISFLCHDLPLEQYCSLISCLAHNNEFWEYFSTGADKQTPVRDLPPQLHLHMQIGRSRARSRFLEMLEVLRLLGIATPLQQTEAERSWITCGTSVPLRFDPAPLENWTTSTSMVAPSFWKLNRVAPIHIWHDSETSPPFWKNMPIDSVDFALHYWDTLRTVSSETLIYPEGELSNGAHSAASVNVSLARSLRRPGSWNSQYILTWHQMQYLKQFIDIHSAKTPLEETDEAKKEELLNKVCRVSSATRDGVISFYRDMRERLLRELEKLKQKEKRTSGDEKRARRTAEVKELLAKKAAEARRKREQDWDALLLRAHPQPLNSAASSRVKRVQKRFLEAGSTQEIEKWERDLLDAIREADMAKALKMSNRPTLTPQMPPPSLLNLPPLPLVLNPSEPPVEELIQRQGAPFEPKEPSKKRKRRRNKRSESTESESVYTSTKAPRRHRFQWTREYDELARDAAAIIKARCRAASRVDWAAFEQVFPAVPRNTVRQRLDRIRGGPGNPGTEAYMNRLEEKWYELWVQHRGTPALPDENPQSTSKFDLAVHIDFLRKHIDKNALRVGYGHMRESCTVVIPSTVEGLLEEFEIDPSEGPSLIWDFMWNANVEEGREKGLMRQAFNRSLENIPPSTDTTSNSVALAEAALKMTLGTPAERYDARQGALILQTVGQREVEAAAKSMISRGALSKLVRDSQKSVPGRHLKISDMNLNTIGGSVPKDMFENAVALEDVIAADDAWREWPLTATDGDSAGLIELAIEGKLDFKIDTSQPQEARVTLDWNSKKAGKQIFVSAVFDDPYFDR